MADNSNNRKKTLFVSVLLFLAAGGGVFLFMVIQGSNDLTKGKGNTFTYGSAAREGVSSFFKYIGLDNTDEFVVSKSGAIRAEAKGILAGEAIEPAGDVSKWMEPPAARSSASGSPTAVPKMGGGGGMSGVGGLGSGGSKSSGGISRYGEGSSAGNTRITNSGAAGTGGAAGKGTMASLARANSNLGEGLRSGSAMTAKGKWDSSFGVGGGSGKGSDLTYGKGSLVNLDGIKKGEINNLKVANAKSLKVTEPGEFERDEKAESKDPTLQAAKEDAKEAAEAAAKKAAIQAALQAAANGASGTASPKPSEAAPPTARADTPAGGTAPAVPPEVMTTLQSGFCTNDCMNGGGTVSDTNALVAPNSDGTYSVTYLGSKTIDGVKTPNVEVWQLSKDGKVMGQLR